MTKLQANRPPIARTQDRGIERAYRPWQVRIFTATWLAYAGYYFCRKPFYVVKADMGLAFGLSSVQLGHLGTAYLAAYAIGQFSSAYFGRKLGPKLLLLAGIAISVACNFIFGIANGFWTLMLFLAVNGIVQGTGWPGCIGSLAFWFRREQRGSVLGVWSTCYTVGSLVSTAFAAYLLGRAGWRWSYFGCALVLLAVWLYHIDEPSHDEPFIIPVRGRDFVTVPYTLHMNDIVAYPFEGWNPDAYEQALKDELDQLYQEAATRRRMMVISLHDRISGHAARVRVLDRFLTYAKSKPDIWFARKDEIARWALSHRSETPIIVRASPLVTGLPGPTA